MRMSVWPDVPAHGLQVDLGHQGAGGVDALQPAAFGLGDHAFGDPVGAEDEHGPVRDLVVALHEAGPLGGQGLHHVAVVHDLVPDVDRGSEDLERLLHDLDGALDAGAATAGACQEDGHGGHSSGGLYSPP